MKRPKIKIQLETIDKVIEVIGILGLIVLIALPLIYFNELPETIPEHFGADGMPNGFSEKGVIWTLPIIGIITYLVMLWLNKYPHFFNYPKKVTEDNAARLYKMAMRMIRVLKAFIVYTFAYITYATVQIAFENQDGLGTLFPIIFIVFLLVIIGFFLYESMKKSDL